MRLQSGLGVVAPNSNKVDRTWTNGSLVIGKVIKVHHKRYTADVQIYGSSQSYGSSYNNEGCNACKILTPYAGYNISAGKPYGEIIPIAEGSIVLIGFIDNGSINRTPVILGMLHDAFEDIGRINPKNILPSAYPLVSDIEKYRYTKITRSQDFITVDGIGNFELFSHTRSFIAGVNNRVIDEETFDYDDLSIRDVNGDLISAPEEDSEPMKFLAVFRKNFKREILDNLRLIVDAAKTSFKLMKIQNSVEKMSMIYISESGTIRIKRQLDSHKTSEDSTHYSEIVLHDNGGIKLSHVCPDKSTTVVIDDNGIGINSEGSISVTSDKDITLKGDVILDGNLSVSGSLTHEGEEQL